jgi:hypothetical protein
MQANTEAGQDWQPTGERRWRVIKRADGFRTVRSEREEIEMNGGERRWVAFAHRTQRQGAAAGVARRPKFERTEPDTDPTLEVLPWTHDP